jgi:cytochrome P450
LRAGRTATWRSLSAFTPCRDNLARLEARIALSRFLRRFPRYALTADPMRARRARFRGFLHLPASVAD